MRFDPELMREVLLDIEAIDAGLQFAGMPDPPAKAEHMRLLIADGYLEGKVHEDAGGRVFQIDVRGLTMKGHQFLANARNNTIWKKVIADAKERGLSVGVSVLNGLLEGAAKKYAGLDK
jgi:hypothetical protein